MFLVQPTCPPVNDSFMELMVMIDACKRASARSITAVIPYYGYARADRKSHGRRADSPLPEPRSRGENDSIHQGSPPPCSWRCTRRGMQRRSRSPCGTGLLWLPRC